MRHFFGFLLTLCALNTFAAEPPATAIHSRHVLDVRTGNVSDAWIVVRGERIESITKSAPSGAKVIDLGDATVLPGLIDCHVHLVTDWTDFTATSYLRQSSPQKELFGLLNSWAYLDRGFTTLRDAGEATRHTDRSRCATRSTRGCFAGRGSSSPAFRSPSPADTPI